MVLVSDIVPVPVPVPVILLVVPYYYCLPGVNPPYVWWYNNIFVLSPLPMCNLYTCIVVVVVVVSVPYYLVHCSLFLFLFFCCCSMIIPIIVYQEWIQGVCLNNIAVPVPVPYPFPVHSYCLFFILLFHWKELMWNKTKYIEWIHPKKCGIYSNIVVSFTSRRVPSYSRVLNKFSHSSSFWYGAVLYYFWFVCIDGYSVGKQLQYFCTHLWIKQTNNNNGMIRKINAPPTQQSTYKSRCANTQN